MDVKNGLLLLKGKTVSKLLVILFVTLMCSVLVITSADDSAAAVNDPISFNGINYVVTSEDPLTVKVSGYTGTPENLVIPSTVVNDSKTYSVTFIGDKAFKNCSSLISIVIPNSVTSIGSSAFTGCSNLTSAIIGNGVISIGISAFSECSSLTSIIIPNMVTFMGPQAFSGCSGLISVTIGSGVTYIGNQAFLDCFNLISIVIPANVTFIGDQAFSGCFGLTSVTIPKSVTFIGDKAFSDCKFNSSGEEITPQTASNLAGYTYSGSNCKNLVQYVQSFTVSFISGEETILSYKIGPGATIVLPIYYTTKEPNDKYDYIFGWEGYTEGMTVADNTTFNATFYDVLRSYIITWVVDETETTTTVEYDTVPVYGTPIKVKNAQYIFTFNKWVDAFGNEPVAVKGPATYIAEFNETLRSYIITWVAEGTEITTTVDYGILPTFNGTPAKVETAQYTFTFNKWVDAFGDEMGVVTGPAKYKAEFNEVLRSYAITWIFDGTETITKVDYGTLPVYGTPLKDPTAQYIYTFKKWNSDPVAVTGPATYTAEFDEILRSHIITWIVEGSKTTTMVDYDTIPVYGIPIKDPTAQYTYTFKKWNSDPVAVTGPATYTAEFNEILRSYIITWVFDGTKIITTVDYGTVPTFVVEPTKDPTAQYTYIFKWNVEPVAVKGPATYIEEFDQVFRIYTKIPSTEVLNNLISESDAPVLQINETATGTIDNSVFESLVKPLTINVMDGNKIIYSWIFDGEYKEDPGIFNVSIEATPDEDLDEDLRDAINSINIENPLVLNFAASGELPINASVRYDVGDKYANGTELLFFFYNEETKQLEDQSQPVIVTDGSVTFKLTHGSSYVLAELTPDAAAANNNAIIYVVIAVLIVVIISLVAVVLIRSKNTE